MKLRAEVYTRKQLGQALENPHIDKIYAPYNIVDSSIAEHKERIILVPPLYLADCEDSIAEQFTKLKEVGFNNTLVHTIAHIELFKNLSFNLFGGHRLNCTNSESIAFYAENDVVDIIASPELTAFQINSLKKSCDIGFISYGRLPLMITRRCPIKNGKPCNKDCCSRTLTDRKGNKLPVICNENTAEILNSDTLYLADKLTSFKNTDFTVLKFTIEDDINPVVTVYLNNESPSFNGFTRGLYFRGIVN